MVTPLRRTSGISQGPRYNDRMDNATGPEPTLIRKIRLENLLSFGPDGQELDLGPLNVLIGRNGSGKSNLPAALSVLAAAPGDLPKPIRVAGGAGEWLWKGTDQPPVATIEATVDHPEGSAPLIYRLSFTAKAHRFTLVDETIENADPSPGDNQPSYYYRYQNHQPIVNNITEDGSWEEQNIDPTHIKRGASVMSQLKDPVHMPQMDYLAKKFEKILIYPQWSFDKYSPPRLGIPTDMPAGLLLDDASNLALVINNLLNKPTIRREILEKIRVFDPDVEDVVTSVQSQALQINFHEKGLQHPVSAMHLGDGALQYLCLLAVLYNPVTPSLICLSEPETHLHPDIIPEVAKLLIEASSRTQIIVTTQSDMLIDSLTELPESVVVCEKINQSTQLNRLNPEQMQHWLDEYRLGDLWTSGEIGGNRW